MMTMARMLIVEDCASDFELIQEYIRDSFEIDWSRTLREAVEKLNSTNPDVILLDVHLPDSPSYLDTIAEVKRHRKDAPIIVVSGESDPTTIERGIEENADGWLTKSTLTAKSLLHQISEGIERHRLCSKVREGIEHLKK